MRRELTIRCVSTGTVRTESADGARCELHDIGLELDGAPAHVRIVETRDGDQCTRDTLVEFGRAAVRQRASRNRADAPARAPLDWLVEIAATMEEGASRTVSLWVRTPDPAALLHATPVTAMRPDWTAHEFDGCEAAASHTMVRAPHLRLVETGS